MAITVEIKKNVQNKPQVGDFFLVADAGESPKLRSIVILDGGYSFVTYTEGLPTATKPYKTLDELWDAVVKSWDEVNLIPSEKVKIVLA